MLGVTQKVMLEELKMIFVATVIILILGLILEGYLLSKKSKYSVFVPVFFFIYPFFRTPIILGYEGNWAYKLPELVYIFTPFVITEVYFIIKKLLVDKKEFKKNKEIDKMKIQDL